MNLHYRTIQIQEQFSGLYHCCTVYTIRPTSSVSYSNHNLTSHKLPIMVQITAVNKCLCITVNSAVFTVIMDITGKVVNFHQGGTGFSWVGTSFYMVIDWTFFFFCSVT